MTTKKIIDCEHKHFYKLINFRLPHKFLRVGIAVVLLSIIVMFMRAFLMEGDTEWLKTISKQCFLIGMLLMSVTRDREEDEMTKTLRSQSYAIAFVVGVVYALVLPYVELGVSNAVNSGGETFKPLGDFQVLSFMLMIQLMFYHNLKRYR